jgi:hypothetical protein
MSGVPISGKYPISRLSRIQMIATAGHSRTTVTVTRIWILDDTDIGVFTDIG